MIEVTTGVHLLCEVSDKYTTNQLEIKWFVPYTIQKVFSLKLLAKYLENGSSECASRVAVERQLADLYGATLGMSVQRLGDYVEVSYTTSCVKNSLLPSDEQVIQRWLTLTQNIVLNQSFEQERHTIFEREKRQLVNELEREKDVPEVWSLRLLYHQLVQTQHARMIERVESLTLHDIQEAYQELMNQAVVYVTSHGELSQDTLEQWVSSWHLLPRCMPVDIQRLGLEFTACDVACQVYEGQVQQSYIAMAYALPVITTLKEKVIAIVANALFGGASTSYLFKDIRETKGLAYSIESHIDDMRHLLIVNAVVDDEATEEVCECIQHIHQHFATLCQDAHCDDAKRVLWSETLEALDSPVVDLENVFYREVIPLQAIEKQQYQTLLASLTRKDIVDYVAQWQYVTCAILKGEA